MHLTMSGLKKLTKCVTELTRRPKSPPRPVLVVAMAEQEEDFSSLPLPDRFQHKVPLSVRERLGKELTGVDMESSKSRL